MAFPYKRRKPSILRNFWVYRRLVGLAMVLGLLLWFIWANSDPVTVNFPFRLGQFTSTTGRVILMSALVGSVTTALTMTLVLAIRKVQIPSPRGASQDPENLLPDDRPPADYAAKASEAPPDSEWP